MPLSNYKFFVSMVYLSLIYNGSFARLFQEQSGIFCKHTGKEALICGILLPATLKNSNENILLLAECFRNYIMKKRLWYMCFPMNFSKFLRTPFLQNTSGGCSWNCNMKIRFHVKFFVSLMHILVSRRNTIHKYLYEEFLCNNL